EAAAANPGMEYVVFDQENAAEVQALAAQMRERFPRLNVLINNAGIQRMEDLTSGETADAEATMNTNLMGPIRMIAEFLQQLMSQPHGAILNVSSALG